MLNLLVCPTENAFLVYRKIIYVFQRLKIAKNTLILISLGPAASVLSYDICKIGYQAINIGHSHTE